MVDFARPFTAFNFKVNLRIDGQFGDEEVCDASFSECDGLEISLEPKTIREGGNNGRQIHLVGPVSYGQLTLKRGVTDNAQLWDWIELVNRDQKQRATGEVLILSSDREDENVRFALTGCLPIRLKAPALKAADGGLAIEEMQIAYETLERVKQ